MKKNNPKYVIGVSGGPDSMCLLDKYKNKIIAVCHVNYHMRESADRDQSIVKNYCQKNNLNFFLKNCFFNKENKTNFQDWARTQRYDFMVEVAKKFQCNTILVAHHLNDFIETALIQLEKKSKTLFLGINKFSYYKGIKIYRPFLQLKKEELIKYCKNKNIDYGIDESNFDLKYLRNKLRQKISKWSKLKFNNFYKKILIFNKENKTLKNKIDKFYDNWKIDKSSKSLLLKKEHFIFQIIYKLLINYDIDPTENKISMIITLMKKNNPNKWCRLGNNFFLSCQNKKIVIEKR